ncbi:unknown protein [Oryza sativa Japonica Group]|uniref:Uncharacterized protein n=2 Tax=Oryza sativa subsp. japonica TaxID=39947 RepID=Q5ZDQ4_ORYSJ|nr:unknown protein [Oryza sativa Japonica Group]BAD52754.1 unknown protein [Oryza sativa Japonica Group]
MRGGAAAGTAARRGAARLRRDSDGDGTLSSPAVVSSGGHLLPGEFLPFPSPLASSSSVRVSCARATAAATATAHDGDRHGGGRRSITPPHGGAVEALALRQGEAGGHGSVLCSSQVCTTQGRRGHCWLDISVDWASTARQQASTQRFFTDLDL